MPRSQCCPMDNPPKRPRRSEEENAATTNGNDDYNTGFSFYDDDDDDGAAPIPAGMVPLSIDDYLRPEGASSAPLYCAACHGGFDNLDMGAKKDIALQLRDYVMKNLYSIDDEVFVKGVKDIYEDMRRVTRLLNPESAEMQTWSEVAIKEHYVSGKHGSDPAYINRSNICKLRRLSDVLERHVLKVPQDSDSRDNAVVDERIVTLYLKTHDQLRKSISMSTQQAFAQNPSTAPK